jgi:hypothetical protein
MRPSAATLMTDFEARLKEAIERGERRGDRRAQDAKAKALSEEECRRLHSKYRLELSERIEECVGRLSHHFPGFQFETIFGERGWGAACRRDDVAPRRGGQRTNFYSRLEMTIRPYSSLHVLDLGAKGTVRNKEIYSRNHFEKLDEADMDNFMNLIDLWVLEYAEMFAAA